MKTLTLADLKERDIVMIVQDGETQPQHYSITNYQPKKGMIRLAPGHVNGEPEAFFAPDTPCVLWGNQDDMVRSTYLRPLEGSDFYATRAYERGMHHAAIKQAQERSEREPNTFVLAYVDNAIYYVSTPQEMPAPPNYVSGTLIARYLNGEEVKY